jgi:hypothetical protein
MKWFVVLLVPMSIFAQTNEKIVKIQNQQVIDYFTRNLQVIKEVDGKNWVAIPVEQTIKKNETTTIVDHCIVQYKKTGNKVAILDIPTTMKVFNFKTKKISIVKSKTDKDIWKRPKDVDIIKKIEKKEKIK